jgi:RNA polymerase primary sigma factor
MKEAEILSVSRVSRPPRSLDEPAGPRARGQFADILADTAFPRPDQHAARAVLQDSVSALLRRELSETEDRIVRQYFGIGTSAQYTLDEIGIRMGLTRERVRQLKQRALDKLRRVPRKLVAEMLSDT